MSSSLLSAGACPKSTAVVHCFVMVCAMVAVCFLATSRYPALLDNGSLLFAEFCDWF